jgi:spore germination protein GerM
MKICLLMLMIFTFSLVSFAQKSETMKIKLYFTDLRNNDGMEDCAKVRAVTRTVPKTNAVAKAALEELFKGTTKSEQSDELSSIFSEETKAILISIKIKKGAAYINLKKDIIQTLRNRRQSGRLLRLDSSRRMPERTQKLQWKKLLENFLTKCFD